MKLILNVDMDGVIYDFHSQMTSYAEQILDRKLVESGEWSMYEEWGIERSEFYQMFHRAIAEDELFSRGMEIEGAVAAVHQLHRDGHRIRIVTSKKLRNDESSLKAQKQTLTWLYTHGLLGIVEVAFATDKQGYTADVVIDDKPTMQWAQPSALNILFDQPWNRDIETPLLHNGGSLVVRGYGWKDVLTHVGITADQDSGAPSGK